MPYTSAIRSGYGDPRTPHGVALRNPVGPAGQFVVHEAGWLPHGLHWQFPQVLSPFWRLYHNPQPGWRIVHQGRSWPLAPNCLLLVPDGLMFDCEGEAGVPHLWIHFGLVSALQSPPVEPVALALTPPLEVLARQLMARLDTGEAPAAIGHTASAILHETFAHLDPATLATHPPKLAELLAHVDRHPSADHSNAALARRAGLSESAFIRWFRAATGTTPAVHVQRIRLKTAAHALLTSTRSIEDIAASVGFRNRHHFSRVFARQFHCGPATYRRA